MSPWICYLSLVTLGATPGPGDADPYRSALVAAVHHFVREGEVDHLAAILDKHPRLVDAPLEYAPGRKPSQTDSFTPLQLAAEFGHDRVAAELIRRGADVNARDELGRTPLILAAQGGHLATVKLLAGRGARLDARTDPIPESSGILPGSPPAGPGSPADPSPPKIYPAIPSRTALEWAIASGKPEVVAYLKALAKE